MASSERQKEESEGENMIEKMWCYSCQEYHDLDVDKPLNEQYSAHTWMEGKDALRLKTNEDYEDEYLEEGLDRETCPECGVPHGPNPYMECG